MGNLTEWALDGHAPLTFANDPLGNETARQTATGFGLQQSWDAVGQLTRQAGAGIARAYDWSRAYEPTRIKDDRWGEKRYEYDQNGQISRTRHGDGGEERFSYGPDLNLSGSGDLEQFTTWQTSAAGVVRMARGPRGEGVALEHDVCGRVVKRTITRNGFRPRVWTFDWNAMDQMIAAHCPDGRVWRYAYDPFGRRVSKETPGTRHDFLWDGDVIARETVNGHAVDWFFEPASFRPLARLENGALAYVVNDHLGTPKEVISERGALLWAADHDTWGSLRAKAVGQQGAEEEDYWLTLSNKSAQAQPDWHPDPTFCPIRFQGQWEDAETGLHYNRFRYGDPGSGQFLSADPVGLIGGHRPNALVSTPTTLVDPDGLTPLDAPGYGLYHIVDSNGQVAYVGISNNIDVRRAQHEITGRLGDGYELVTQERELTYAQARGYEQADIEHFGTRDLDRRGLPFEAGEANRCNGFDPSRCDERGRAFNQYREERLRSLCCGG